MWRGGAARQYPGEKEITFPPFTCLESNGEPYLQRTPQGEVVVFPLKVLHHSAPALHQLYTSFTLAFVTFP
jgi:hypothetical protein